MKLAWAVAALLAAASTLQSPVEAQQPDTLRVPPEPARDTVVLPDSANLVVTTDTLLGQPVADTIPDSLRVYRVPEVEGRPPAGVATAVWIFERADLLALRGLSLADLLAQVPGITRLRGGDYGAPETVTAYGLAGGGIRLFWDGFEQIPLHGSVADLSLIGLGGVERVRVERHPGELRVELTSLHGDEEPRPVSLIEAGTGDLDTNFFRGSFVHPRALGGSLGLVFDRVDTNGPNREEGNRMGGWLRYTRHWGDDLALTAEARRMKSGAAIDGFPGEATRTDWVMRARWRPLSGLVLQGYTGRSTLDGLERPERLPVVRGRAQHGITADLVRGPVRASGALRALGGNDLPSFSGDLSVTAELPELGGAVASTSQELWNEATVGRVRLAAWSRPLFGVSIFGGWESGTRGVPLYPLPPEIPELSATVVPEPEPGVRFHARTALRAGARFAWRSVDLSAARVALEGDSLPLLGLPMDRAGELLGGIERTGVELSVRAGIPFVSDGFALLGAVTLWDEPARYLPERSYQAAVVFHDLFFPSRQLEVWASLGVEGRDPMLVPVADPELPDAVPATVPFYQSWHGFVQVRVQMFRIFVSWENFTIRRNNQDFPGRVLPITRATYGVRWSLFD